VAGFYRSPPIERRSIQPTFLDYAVTDLGSPKANAFFARVNKHVRWADLAEPCNAFYAKKTGKLGKRGRPHWPVVMMVKIMMLRKWFGLSDVQAEEQIRDRISFRLFLSLSMNDATPDHSTIRLFNARLTESGLCSDLFEGVLAQMSAKGLLVQNGSIVDATLLETGRGSNREDGTSTRDPGATTTAKGGLPYFGFRAHIRADTKAVIKDYRFDTARESEHTHFDELVAGEKDAVYADSGYMKKARSQQLEDAGIFPGIMHRRVRGQKELTDEQKGHNRFCAKLRAFVEHPFGWMKNMGYKIRYRGVRKNGADFGLAAAAYNLKRMLSLIDKDLSNKLRAAAGRLQGA
jgi:IS5 family transposase